MFKHARTKLRLSLDTIRNLTTHDLARAHGGGSQVETCSMCAALTGCHTGDACPATGVKDSEPGGVCWPDPPPR